MALGGPHLNLIVTIYLRTFLMITCHSSLSCSATVLDHGKIDLKMIRRPIFHQGTKFSTLVDLSFG